MLTQQLSLLDIYHQAAKGHQNDLTQDLWGDIPSSYQNLKRMVEIKKRELNFKTYNENNEVLRNIAIERHRKLGTLTSQVKETLQLLDHGFLDVGHQPLILGGSLFLINKVSLAEWLGKYLNLGSYFFIGDHDSLQNELTVSRFPQANSHSGLVLTPSGLDVPDGTPMHQVPVPQEVWFQEVKSKIQDNLRLLMKMAKIKQEYRHLLIERFYSWFDLIYDSAIAADGFSIWIQKLWSQLFNIRNELRIFLSPSSDPRYRKLILPAFEFLLKEDNRNRYIETLDQIYDLIISHSMQPGLPYRDNEYVPFFLECLRCKNKTRVELSISNPGILEGKCIVCSESYSFSYNPKQPDLSEIGKSITPRSDSRAVVNNITFPLLAHIGGSGETKYYSAVIPAMKRLKINPPILIRSNRVYYNTPWAQKSAHDSDSLILDDKGYKIFNEFNNSTDEFNTQKSLEKMRVLLLSKYDQKIKELVYKQEDLDKNSADSRLRKEIKKIELMLSHNFGRFAPKKSAQEVSWNWFDLAVLTGIHNICNIFQRQLKETAFLGHTWYITPGKFT